MKLSAFFLVVCLQMAMASSAQTVSLSVEEAPLQNVFDSIYEQTGYEFLYNSQLLANSSPVTIEVDNASLEDVLALCFRNQPLSYVIRNKTIVIQNKNQAVLVSKQTQQDPIRITGKVTDENDVPLAGASVIVQGTSIGVSTDFDGNYDIRVPNQESILEFSYIGYETKQVTVGNQVVINTILQEAVGQLDEVVVSTGYYKVEQRLNPGNIAKVDAKIIEQQPVSNPLQALQGRLAGVNIQQTTGVPGGSFNIQIRGLNSLREDGNDPLYLVNGVPYPSQSLNFNGGQLVGNINPLNFINPNDIESIEILKDADATAIYGTRGANGVVRITTKTGKVEKFNVTFNTTVGIGSVANKLDLLNTEQYLTMRREALRNDGVEPSATDFDVNGTWSENRDIDWQDEFLSGSSEFTNHQLSFSGGSQNTTFLVGLNYLKETTLFSDDFFDEKFSTNLNINHISPDKKFEMAFQGNILINNNFLFSNNLARTALRLSPNAPALFDENGDLNWENGTFDNPMAGMLRESETRSINFTGNLSLSYEILQGLRLKSVLGYSEVQSDEILINPIAAQNPFSETAISGSSNFGNSSLRTWLVEPQVEYQKKIGRHDFTALVGATLQETVTDRQQIIAEGYSSDALLRNPLASGNSRVNNIDFSEYRFNSLYARLNYMFDEKYILNLTGRRDGSSRFGPGDRFANFGAIGAAWLFSEERFVSENLSFLSFGKLRASYGLTGNDAIGNYEFLELFEPTELGYAGTTGLFPSTLPNAVFAWEETTKAEVGLELGFLKNRFRLNTSYFQNNSSNQLVGQPLPRTTGFFSIQSNFPAEVENTGWEFELNTTNISNGDFQWSSNFNISILRNELVSFDDIENSSFNGIYTVGEPLSVVNLLNYTGVDPETGIATYQDVNGDGRITLQDDVLPLGDSAPDFFGGLGNTLSYKGLTLDFFFRFRKQEGRSLNASWVNAPGDFVNQPVDVLDRWQNPGDVSETPRYTQVGVANVANRNLGNSTQGREDTSFIRLQNVSFSYQFPTYLVNKINLQSLRLYLQGQNLLTITPYRGLDPETESLGLPPIRIITAGLSITL